MTFHVMCVHMILSSDLLLSVHLAELNRLAICSLCNLTICNISYFPFWLDLGSDCFSS